MSLDDATVDSCLAETLAKLKRQKDQEQDKDEEEEDDDFFNNLFSQAPETASQESSTDTTNDTAIRTSEEAGDASEVGEPEPSEALDPGEQRLEDEASSRNSVTERNLAAMPSSQAEATPKQEMHSHSNAERGSLLLLAQTDTPVVDDQKMHAAAGCSSQPVMDELVDVISTSRQGPFYNQLGAVMEDDLKPAALPANPMALSTTAPCPFSHAPTVAGSVDASNCSTAVFLQNPPSSLPFACAKPTRAKASQQQPTEQALPATLISTHNGDDDVILVDDADDEDDELDKDDRDEVFFVQTVRPQSETAEAKQKKLREEAKLMTTVTGRSFLFVQYLLESHAKLTSSLAAGRTAPDISVIALDDLVPMLELMIKQQRRFKRNKINTHVDIGYHYTKSETLRHIRTNGLLTLADRKKNNLEINYNGSAYGDGVYTCSDPFQWESYGDIGLIVARLQGETSTDSQAASRSMYSPLVTARQLNESSKTYVSDSMVVLRNRSQVVPLIRFSKPYTDQTFEYHKKMQFMADMFFNGGASTQVRPFVFSPPTQPLSYGFGLAATHASSAAAAFGWGASQSKYAGGTWNRNPRYPHAQNAFHGAGRGYVLQPNDSDDEPDDEGDSEVIRYVAPDNLQSGALKCIVQLPDNPCSADDDCAICLNSLDEGKLGQIGCGHRFHYDCIVECVLHSTRCPLCSQNLGGAPQGPMPSGTMTVVLNPAMPCAGYPRGSIEISYQIPDGVQKSYHTYVMRFIANVARLDSSIFSLLCYSIGQKSWSSVPWGPSNCILTQLWRRTTATEAPEVCLCPRHDIQYRNVANHTAAQRLNVGLNSSQDFAFGRCPSAWFSRSELFCQLQCGTGFGGRAAF